MKCETGSGTNGTLPAAGAAAAGNLCRDLAFSGGLFSQEPGTGVQRRPKYQECVHLPIDLDQSACCCKARALAGVGAKEEREAGRGEEPRVLT